MLFSLYEGDGKVFSWQPQILLKTAWGTPLISVKKFYKGGGNFVPPPFFLGEGRLAIGIVDICPGKKEVWLAFFVGGRH